MKKVKIFSALILFVLLIAGCAPVKFYSNSGLTQTSGLKYYTLKPFLLVEKESSTNNVVKATVVYMPDLENPQFMVLRDGFGSRKVDLKLTDGTINTFGVSSEADLAETIEALSAVIDKSAEAVKDITLKGVPGAPAATYVELYDVSMMNGTTNLRKIDFQ